MKRAFEAGVTDPSLVVGDARRSMYAQGMANMIGPQGQLPAPYAQDLRQFSSQAISTTSVPATTLHGVGNPRVDFNESMARIVEMKTVWSSLNEEAVMIGQGGVAPLTPTTSQAFVIERTRVNSHMPDRVPVRGRVRMGTIEKESRTGTLSSYGVGIEMPIRFMMDVEGAMHFRLAIEQTNIGVRDFLILMAYNMFIQARDMTADADAKWRKNNGIAARRIKGWLRREMMFLGAMQRLQRPIKDIMTFMEEDQRLIGTSSDTLLADHRLARFMSHIPAYTEYFRAGPAGPAAANGSPSRLP